MATPINVFKSVAYEVTTSPETIYTSPTATTAIVLLAQATNVSNSTASITFYSSINGGTELVKDFSIPAGDASSMLTGKLVIEAGQSVGVYASANSALKLTLSLLETL